MSTSTNSEHSTSSSQPAALAATAPAARRRSPPRRITVKRIAQLTPKMVRITFDGDELAGFPMALAAAYIKLVFPAPGEHQAPMPTPDGPRPTSMRTYTPLRFAEASRELDVDFVIHGEGPASNWAQSAMIGDALALMGPGPGYAVDMQANWFWLIGDDSALPAIETILDRLPAASRVEVFAEIVDTAEQRSLGQRHPDAVHQLHRGPDARDAGVAIERALSSAPIPSGPGRIYVACEAGAMRRVRKLLVDTRRIDRSILVTRGYWQLDEVNHPDHDYGDEPRPDREAPTR